MDLPLVLGGLIFQSFEIPESFRKLGGKQAHSIREFPGGLRTIRNLGYFPLPLEWSGYLYGPQAFSRAQALAAICAAGSLIQLQYGPWVWEGELVSFEGHPRHQFLVPYTCRFEPTRDLSGAGGNPSSATSAENTMATQSSSLNTVSAGSASTLSS